MGNEYLNKNASGISRILAVVIIVIIIVTIVAGLIATGHLRIRTGQRTTTTSSSQAIIYRATNQVGNTSLYRGAHVEEIATLLG
jgi:hypothetical protein